MRGPHPGGTEAHHVVGTVAGDVGEEPGVLLHPPAARVVPEVGDCELRGLEGAVAVVDRYPDAVIAEPDDVGAGVVGEPGQEPRMLVDPPVAGVVSEVRHDEDRHRHGAEGVNAPAAEHADEPGVVRVDVVAGALQNVPDLRIGEEPVPGPDEGGDPGRVR